VVKINDIHHLPPVQSRGFTTTSVLNIGIGPLDSGILTYSKEVSEGVLEELREGIESLYRFEKMLEAQ